MRSGAYNMGTTTELSFNGAGCRFLLHVNDRATIEDVLKPGFFDLANRNRGKHPWITPGDFIEVDAFDGYVRLRVMTMDDNHASIETMPVTGPVMFDDHDKPKARPKGKPGRPTNEEIAARKAAEAAQAAH